jgi:hypothetical protein
VEAANPRKLVALGAPPAPVDRLVWVVRLDAIDSARETKETIWIEVAGDEPKLTGLLA